MLQKVANVEVCWKERGLMQVINGNVSFDIIHFKCDAHFVLYGHRFVHYGDFKNGKLSSLLKTDTIHGKRK